MLPLADGSFTGRGAAAWNAVVGRLSEVYSAREFGATGDGVSNDYPALAAAVAAATTNGGTVFLSPGMYKTFTNTLTIPANVSLKGAGIAASIIYYTGSSVAVQGGDTAAAVDTSSQLKGSFEDFGILGNGYTVVGSIGLTLTKCKDGLVKNVQATGVETGFKVDGSNGFCASNEFYRLRTSNVKTGLVLTGTTALRGCNNNHVFGGYIFGDGTKPAGGIGVSVVFGDTNSFHGTAVESFDTAWSITSLSATGHRFFSTRDESCTSGMTFAASTTKNLVVGHGAGTAISDGGTSNTVISENSITTTAATGFRFIVGAPILDNAKFYQIRNAAGTAKSLFGLDANDDIVIIGNNGSGDNIVMDTNNATGIYAFRLGGGNVAFLGPNTGLQMQSKRLQGAQGTVVTAANNLALGTGGNYFQVDGATQINLLDNSSWQGGAEVTLKFNSNPTVKNNQAASGNNKPILLAGAADFVASANDTLTLIYDSTDSAWYETSRVVI